MYVALSWYHFQVEENVDGVFIDEANKVVSSPGFINSTTTFVKVLMFVKVFLMFVKVYLMFVKVYLMFVKVYLIFVKVNLMFVKVRFML